MLDYQIKRFPASEQSASQTLKRNFSPCSSDLLRMQLESDLSARWATRTKVRLGTKLVKLAKMCVWSTQVPPFVCKYCFIML